MRIAIFNVRYSPNLGDGILSACLEGELRASGEDIDVQAYDLAGRVEYGQKSRRRAFAIRILGFLPSAIRRYLVVLILGRWIRYALQPRWREALRSADLVLVGGGHLLSDIELNFPLKLDGLSRELKKSQMPWGVFAVGVSDNWSSMGRRLFRQVFHRTSPEFVVVRDIRSKRLWNEATLCSNVPSAQVCPDPAVLCFRYLPAPDRTIRETRIFGLNVISPGELKLHCGGAPHPDRFALWLVELASRALADGYQVVVFSNGNPQDDDTVRDIELRWKNMASKPDFPPRPRTPQELAATIAGCDLLAGHRLHLHISAFSYRIPTVGFLWDPKLTTFFESVERAEFLVDIGDQSPQDAWNLLLKAATVRWNEEKWTLAVCQASDAVRSIVRHHYDNFSLHRSMRNNNL